MVRQKKHKNCFKHLMVTDHFGHKDLYGRTTLKTKNRPTIGRVSEQNLTSRGQVGVAAKKIWLP
jgi:hypothetical protein